MAVIYPLSPIDRHTANEPCAWLAGLTAQYDAIGDHGDTYLFRFANSLALLLTLSGAPGLADDVLSRSVSLSVAGEDDSQVGLDSFVNLLRLANQTGDSARFESLFVQCVSAVVGSSGSHNLVLLGFPIQLSAQRRVALAQHLIYQSIVHLATQGCDRFHAVIEENRSSFEIAGLIFRESLRYRHPQFAATAPAILSRSSDATEALMAALYSSRWFRAAGNTVESARLTGLSLLLFEKLLASGGVSHKHFRIIEELGSQLLRCGKDDRLRRLFSEARDAVHADWYMAHHYCAKLSGESRPSMRSTYAVVREQASGLANAWLALFAEPTRSFASVAAAL